MEFGDIRGRLDEIVHTLDQINRNTSNNSCCEAITSAGQDISVPSGFNAVSIVQTSASGTVGITMSDGSTFILSAQGQTYSVSAAIFQSLPAFLISGTAGATWEWSAIK